MVTFIFLALSVLVVIVEGVRVYITLKKRDAEKNDSPAPSRRDLR